MRKLAILKLYGTVETGFQAALEIGQEGQRPDTEVQGYLPAPGALCERFDEWQKTYRRLGATRALKPKGIELDGTLSNRKTICRSQAKALDVALNQWLKAEEFARIREKWAEKITPSQQVRVIIQSEDVTVQQFPWHRWDLLQRGAGMEIGFSRLEYEYQAESNLSLQTSVRILAILGNSQGIDINRDQEHLKNLGGAIVTFLVEPSRQQLHDQLWEQHWDILFFAGHSQTEGETGRIYLNQTESLTLDELRSALQRSMRHGLQLAIFNSCDGLGLAYELEQLHIPQLIVMRQPVPDRVAQEFLKNFLGILSRGEPFYAAVQQARQRLERLEDEFPCASWLPTIWQNPGAMPFQFPQPPWRRLRAVAATSFLVAVTVLGLRVMGLLQPFELWAFDHLLLLRSDETSDPRLLVVEVTEEDIKTYRHPLSGQVLTQALQTIEAGNPRAIGLDIFQDIPQEPGYDKLMTFLQHSDRTIAVCQHDQPQQPGVAPPPVPNQRVGFSDVVLDPDDVIRRHLLAVEPIEQTACQTELAFSVLLALKYLNAAGMTERETADGLLQMGEVVFKPLDWPIAAYQQTVDLHGHQIFLNYRRHQGSVNDIAQRASLTALLNGQVAPSAIRDRVVLIGVTATSVKDEFNTPYGEKLRGLMLHTQMVSQILSVVLDDRPLLWAWSWWGDCLWIGSWAAVGGLLSWRISASRTLGLALSGGICVLSGICWIMLLQGGWIPLVPAAIALGGSSLGAAQVLRQKFPQRF